MDLYFYTSLEKQVWKKCEKKNEWGLQSVFVSWSGGNG